ncbi:MAG: ATP-binding cassette domain-containing protein [Nitrospirae bacterium]|nr:MAG: ATP-binding cassette domain-containing protein [Nitrospirota bacterium]
MADAGEAVIVLDRVSASEGILAHLEDVSFTVRRGEAVALVGANRSGKGLALKLCAGLETPVAGSVRVLGVDPAAASDEEILHLRQRVGFVFAKPALVSNMSLYNNVALPLRYHTALPEAAVQEKVMACLAECGVELFHDHLPGGLAMGHARLAALARALVVEPDILFVDEVLVGLDAADLVRFRGILEKHGQRGLTIVVSINAPTALFAFMDRLALMRDGRLVAVCPPAEVARVDDPMVREFFGNN